MNILCAVFVLLSTFMLIGCGENNQMFGFRKKKAKRLQEAYRDDRTVEEMRNDPNLIRVFDDYGREMFVDKQAWRQDILPQNLQKAWSNPDELYALIHQSLLDGFEEDMLKPSRRLYEIDPDLERSACILGIVLMKAGELDQAESVLKAHISNHGEDGSVLTNLAKVYSAKGEEKACLETLWRALEVDPNLDNGLGWYEVIFREQEGQEAGIQALKRVAVLPGSWRAQLWLARSALDQDDLNQALELYTTALNNAEDPIPTDLMMQMSGDLGNKGHTDKVIELVGPHFEENTHGILVGHNLIRSYIDQGDYSSARIILKRLYALNRHDWKVTLDNLDDTIDNVEHQYGPVKDNEPLSATLLSLSWPVWAHKISGSDKLMPAKREDALSIAYFAATCGISTPSGSAEVQRPNSEGILSRGIPLYLAEHVQMLTDAKATYVVPVVSGNGGFILSGKPWNEKTLLTGAKKQEYDYVVGAHMDTSRSRWEIELIFIEVCSGEKIRIVKGEFNPADPGEGLEKLIGKTMSVLEDLADVQRLKPPIKYESFKGDMLVRYLGAAESTLALSTATSADVPSDFLFGTRSTFDNLLELNLQYPQSEIFRLMLVGALAKNKAYGSEIHKEYEVKVDKIQDNYPLSGVAEELSRETLSEVFSL